ncbi:hypothetical protein HKX48_001982 [Thoreauomyces humboldtii]|nr:hypothetical protein HKX48_001982 [Thoreauomyces humboldtii]
MGQLQAKDDILDVATSNPPAQLSPQIEAIPPHDPSPSLCHCSCCRTRSREDRRAHDCQHLDVCTSKEEEEEESVAEEETDDLDSDLDLYDPDAEYYLRIPGLSPEPPDPTVASAAQSSPRVLAQPFPLSRTRRIATSPHSLGIFNKAHQSQENSFHHCQAPISSLQAFSLTVQGRSPSDKDFGEPLELPATEAFSDDGGFVAYGTETVPKGQLPPKSAVTEGWPPTIPDFADYLNSTHSGKLPSTLASTSSAPSSTFPPSLFSEYSKTQQGSLFGELGQGNSNLRPNGPGSASWTGQLSQEVPRLRPNDGQQLPFTTPPPFSTFFAPPAHVAAGPDNVNVYFQATNSSTTSNSESASSFPPANYSGNFPLPGASTMASVPAFSLPTELSSSLASAAGQFGQPMLRPMPFVGASGGFYKPIKALPKKKLKSPHINGTANRHVPPSFSSTPMGSGSTAAPNMVSWTGFIVPPSHGSDVSDEHPGSRPIANKHRKRGLPGSAGGDTEVVLGPVPANANDGLSGAPLAPFHMSPSIARTSTVTPPLLFTPGPSFSPPVPRPFTFSDGSSQSAPLPIFSFSDDVSASVPAKTVIEFGKGKIPALSRFDPVVRTPEQDVAASAASSVPAFKLPSALFKTSLAPDTSSTDAVASKAISENGSNANASAAGNFPSTLRPQPQRQMSLAKPSKSDPAIQSEIRELRRQEEAIAYDQIPHLDDLPDLLDDQELEEAVRRDAASASNAGVAGAQTHAPSPPASAALLEGKVSNRKNKKKKKAAAVAAAAAAAAASTAPAGIGIVTPALGTPGSPSLANPPSVPTPLSSFGKPLYGYGYRRQKYAKEMTRTGDQQDHVCFFCEYEQAFGGRMWRGGARRRAKERKDKELIGRGPTGVGGVAVGDDKSGLEGNRHGGPVAGVVGAGNPGDDTLSGPDAAKTFLPT